MGPNCVALSTVQKETNPKRIKELMTKRHSLRSTSVYLLASIIGTGLCYQTRSFAAPPATSTRAASTLASMTAPDSPSLAPEAPTKYPWKTKIVGTVFWVGEQPTENNP